jgi:uncharacterized membrane protein YqjE
LLILSSNWVASVSVFSMIFPSAHIGCIWGLEKNRKYARLHHRRTQALVLVSLIH